MRAGKDSTIALAALAAALLAGCGGSSTSESTAAHAAKTKPVVTVPKAPPPKVLVVKDIEEGAGKTAEAGDQVTVNYVGADYKSGREFDSSWSRHRPFAFNLGAGEVITGWDQGVAGMKVGGRRELIVPPELGYGESGSGSIPPNETLVFVVDLLGVE